VWKCSNWINLSKNMQLSGINKKLVLFLKKKDTRSFVISNFQGLEDPSIMDSFSVTEKILSGFYNW
jgi:hypothetical protein